MPGPGEVHDGKRAVVNLVGHVVAARARGDGSKAVAAELVAGADLDGRLPFKSGGLAQFRRTRAVGDPAQTWRPWPSR